MIPFSNRKEEAGARNKEQGTRNKEAGTRNEEQGALSSGNFQLVA